MTIAKLWTIDIDSQKLRHQSGLLLRIEGDINDPMGIVPLVIPSHISPLDIATLIREGVEYCREYKVVSRSRPILSLRKSRVQPLRNSSASSLNVSPH